MRITSRTLFYLIRFICRSILFLLRLFYYSHFYIFFAQFLCSFHACCTRHFSIVVYIYSYVWICAALRLMSMRSGLSLCHICMLTRFQIVWFVSINLSVCVKRVTHRQHTQWIARARKFTFSFYIHFIFAIHLRIGRTKNEQKLLQNTRIILALFLTLLLSFCVWCAPHPQFQPFFYCMWLHLSHIQIAPLKSF